MLPTPEISIATYVVDVPFHDNRTKQGEPMPDGKPSYAYATLPNEYGLTSTNSVRVFICRRDITLQETSNVWTDHRKPLEEKQAKEPGKDAVIRFPGPRGPLGILSDQYPDVDFCSAIWIRRSRPTSPSRRSAGSSGSTCSDVSG